LTKKVVREIFDSLKGRKILTEPESKGVFEAYDIPVVQGQVVKTQDEAAAEAEKLGFPVALKIVSPDIIHKSDAKCVLLGLDGAEEVKRGFGQVMANAKKFKQDADIHGVFVQRMAQPGREVVIGMNKDPQFGQALMFGLGGILVEVVRDVSFRIAPLSRRDALEMIHEIRGYPILEGARGGEPADIEALADILLAASKLAIDWQEIKEFDLNPIFVYPKGAIAVDARIILE